MGRCSKVFNTWPVIAALPVWMLVVKARTSHRVPSLGSLIQSFAGHHPAPGLNGHCETLAGSWIFIHYARIVNMFVHIPFSQQFQRDINKTQDSSSFNPLYTTQATQDLASLFSKHLYPFRSSVLEASLSSSSPIFTASLPLKHLYPQNRARRYLQ